MRLGPAPDKGQRSPGRGPGCSPPIYRGGSERCRGALRSTQEGERVLSFTCYADGRCWRRLTRLPAETQASVEKQIKGFGGGNPRHYISIRNYHDRTPTLDNALFSTNAR